MYVYYSPFEIPDISTLEIVTRPSGSSTTYCKMFRGAKTLACGLSAGHRDECGTTVTAHDLFYSMPVCANMPRYYLVTCIGNETREIPMYRYGGTTGKPWISI